MTKPTPLSPAAQAVLNAFGNSLTTEQYATTGQIEIAIAAALRAAADQVVPEFWHEDNDIYGETMQDVRQNLLAIAAELDGANAQ